MKENKTIKPKRPHGVAVKRLVRPRQDFYVVFFKDKTTVWRSSYTEAGTLDEAVEKATQEMKLKKKKKMVATAVNNLGNPPYGQFVRIKEWVKRGRRWMLLTDENWYGKQVA